VGAPFNDRLSEAVEAHLQGRPPGTEGGLRGMVLEAADSVLSEIRKLVYWAGWSVPFLVLFVVPFVNVVAPLAWMGFTAWMLAVEYLDYPMARHGLPPARQRELLRAHRLMSLGFGGAVMILIMIPVLNFLAMPAAVAGATAMWVERFSKNYSTV
jgi:CysZ protein